MNGYGTSHTDTLSQTVVVPEGSSVHADVPDAVRHGRHHAAPRTQLTITVDDVNDAAAHVLVATYSNLQATGRLPRSSRST